MPSSSSWQTGDPQPRPPAQKPSLDGGPAVTDLGLGGKTVRPWLGILGTQQAHTDRPPGLRSETEPVAATPSQPALPVAATRFGRSDAPLHVFVEHQSISSKATSGLGDCRDVIVMAGVSLFDREPRVTMCQPFIFRPMKRDLLANGIAQVVPRVLRGSDAPAGVGGERHRDLGETDTRGFRKNRRS